MIITLIFNRCLTVFVSTINIYLMLTCSFISIKSQDSDNINIQSIFLFFLGGVTHYHLSMDTLKGNLLENDGLEAYVHGLPILVPGINNTAIEVDSEKSITVSGPGHRAECFGDLTKCDQGVQLLYYLT